MQTLKHSSMNQRLPLNHVYFRSVFTKKGTQVTVSTNSIGLAKEYV